MALGENRACEPCTDTPNSPLIGLDGGLELGLLGLTLVGRRSSLLWLLERRRDEGRYADDEDTISRFLRSALSLLLLERGLDDDRWCDSRRGLLDLSLLICRSLLRLLEEYRLDEYLS